ncbi:MAG: hypothetical protein F6K39_02980 [Okeania sp. SIO3B3]|nr:hypothetical protein [Okeania sp. SIO3B3]
MPFAPTYGVFKGVAWVISCSVKYLYFCKGKAEGRRQKVEGREQSLK